MEKNCARINVFKKHVEERFSIVIETFKVQHFFAREFHTKHINKDKEFYKIPQSITSAFIPVK